MANTRMGLLGKKLGMTQIFDAAGNAVGATLIELLPNRVLQVKTSKSKDGYAALQLGYGTRRAALISKPVKGHLAKTGEADVRTIAEIRVTDEVAAKYQAGQTISAGEVFAEKQHVDVTGLIKGRGFTGVMKRHNFSGFKRSHGAHEYKRHGGSIGTRLTPGMTLSGMPMPGHYGDAQVTIQNLTVLKIDSERNLVYLLGGVPGANGTVLKIRKAVKG